MKITSSDARQSTSEKMEIILFQRLSSGTDRIQKNITAMEITFPGPLQPETDSTRELFMQPLPHVDGFRQPPM